MTEAMPFLQKYDITFLRPPAIPAGILFGRVLFLGLTVHGTVPEHIQLIVNNVV